MGHFLALVVVWVSVGGGLVVLSLVLCGCVAVSVGAVGAVSGSLVLSCCLWSGGGLVLSLVVFSGLVVSGSGSGSCVGLWVSGGLCVGLWCCVSGGLVWWSVVLSAGQALRKNHRTRKRCATLNDTSPVCIYTL